MKELASSLRKNFNSRNIAFLAVSPIMAAAFLSNPTGVNAKSLLPTDSNNDGQICFDVDKAGNRNLVKCNSVFDNPYDGKRIDIAAQPGEDTITIICRKAYRPVTEDLINKCESLPFQEPIQDRTLREGVLPKKELLDKGRLLGEFKLKT